MVAEHIKYSRTSDTHDEWKIVEDDGDMQVYIRETEMDGITCDPIKATTVVQGVTAFEICEAFFSPAHRMSWETTLDMSEVIETLDEDTLIFHQKHKKVWPASQRDTITLNNIRPISPEATHRPTEATHRPTAPEGKPDPKDEEEEDEDALLLDWITTNFSVPDLDDDYPCGKCVRAKVNGSMVCRTKVRSKNNNQEVIVPSDLALDEVKRDQIRTTVVYQSYVDAGGWVPAAGVRVLAKKEYPRFVRKFSKFVWDQNKDRPIRFQKT